MLVDLPNMDESALYELVSESNFSAFLFLIVFESHFCENHAERQIQQSNNETNNKKSRIYESFRKEFQQISD